MAGTAQEPDSELMEALARRDMTALGALYEKYARMVSSVISRHVSGHSTAEVEDLCHEVFLTALEAAPRYVETGKTRAWLCGIALQSARRARRKHWLRRTLLGRFGREAQPPSSAAGSAGAMEARPDLHRAIAAVPEVYREVLLLHAGEHFSSDEIALALGISEKTVWTRLHRARRALQRALGEVSPDPNDPQGAP